MAEKLNVRAKGQMTLPAYARKKLGVDQGNDVYLRETRDGYEIIGADKIRDVAAGALAKYAGARNPDPAEERAWIAHHIAETADDDE